MKAGFQGTFVLSWAQTEVDGQSCPQDSLLRVGAAWRWGGTAVRVDGPQDVLILSGSEEVAQVRRRAARMVRRLVGEAVMQGRPDPGIDEDAPDCADHSFEVTDGRQVYVLTIVPVPQTGARLLMVVGDAPPQDTDLWVVRTAFGATPATAPQPAGGVICFTPGTKIRTEGGPRMVETLRPGDRVQTRDNGLQEVLWTGQRRMSGARLFAMPHLRPVRFRAGAFGIARPDADLLVSPQHRMLLRGPAARALFNTDEVLVAAQDLLNGRNIIVDHDLREVSYVHVLLPNHNILWANGLESESFHPAAARIDTIEDRQRAGLLALLPFAASTPMDYGGFARRNLTGPEAAILRHELAA